MGVLDTIMQMKGQGLPDDEIISRLREQGVSPREINDALNQSEIKRAVSSMPESMDVPSPEAAEVYTPQSRELSQSEVYAPAPAQEYYSQGGNYQEYAQAGGISTETIIEIVEQVFAEKTKKMQKTIDELAEFKSISQVKIENTLERVKRIEAIIDKLQMAILEKIGSYGENINGIRKEMSMMQDSFGKMVGKTAEHHREKEEPKSKKK